MPVRTIPKNFRNVTGLAQSRKSVGRAAFESTLERDFYELLEFDNSVLSYEVQPREIHFLDASGTARLYRPDVLVEYVDPAITPILYEVKYRSDLAENWVKYRAKFKAAFAYSKLNGMKFKILTEREIKTPFLNNVRFLLPYRRNEPNEEYEQMLLRRVRELRETDPQTLLIAVFRDKWSQAELIPSLWRLIALGAIGSDLKVPLTMASRIWSLPK